jgi:hypothetical protein
VGAFLGRIGVGVRVGNIRGFVGQNLLFARRIADKCCERKWTPRKSISTEGS